jgi:GntR family transcriptional regulator / MocR family aminotransferase
MDLLISLGSTQLSSDLYQQLRAAILDRRLRPGDSLPATRELARRLAVSRNTVNNAYQRLIAAGLVVGRIGAGTFVSQEVPSSRPRRAPRGGVLRPSAAWSAHSFEQAAPVEADYDFRIGVPDARLFPWDLWRRALARQLRPARLRWRGYGEPQGHLRLREAIARHIGVSRSVRAGAEDVLVTSGAQQGLDLIGRVLVEPGSVVAVEDPGYPPARRALLSLGARVVPVPVDAEGLQVAQLPRGVRLVYVTPSHQFPLGTPMSLARRMALLEWAEREGAGIIEDDYDCEFRFDGRPLEPLHSLDRHGRVLYLGTFSKVLLPALRIGFVVPPASLMASFRRAKALADSHGPLDTQAALAELMEEGLFARHVRRVRAVYQERRDQLVDALHRHLGDQLTPLPSSAGLHLSALFNDHRFDADALQRSALARKLAIQPLRPFYLTRARSGLALGFGAIPTVKIEEGVRRLAACVHAQSS